MLWLEDMKRDAVKYRKRLEDCIQAVDSHVVVEDSEYTTLCVRILSEHCQIISHMYDVILLLEEYTKLVEGR